MIENKQLKQLFYVDHSDIHGRGLYAKVIISKGTYLGTYHGPMVKKNGSHVLWVESEDGDDWIGCDGKNILRYLNHSRKPQAEFDGFDLYALKKITPGTEVTIDYGEEFD